MAKRAYLEGKRELAAETKAKKAEAKRIKKAGKSNGGSCCW